MEQSVHSQHGDGNADDMPSSRNAPKTAAEKQTAAGITLKQEPVGAVDRVAMAILRDLEQQRLVPGQRLIETDLANRLGIGRNAVREAIHQLAAKGIVDLSRNRSPSIRRLTLEETLEVLEVAEVMTGLLTRIAARSFDRVAHLAKIQKVMQALESCAATRDDDAFNHLRRFFYRTLLDIGGNRELERHFGAINMQIVSMQYRSPRFQDLRFADYRNICESIIRGDIKAAQDAGRRHVRRVRSLIIELSETRQ